MTNAKDTILTPLEADSQVHKRNAAAARSIFAPKLFEGKTAIISGGATGIGFAIARELGQLGAHVILASRTIERLQNAVDDLRKEGIKADSHPVNIRNEQEVKDLFDTVTEQWGTVDFLINNAGGQFAAPALNLSLNGFKSVVDLNLHGTWLMSSAFAHHLTDNNKNGRIINIVLCLASGIPGMVHASAARAGVVNMTKTLASEWGPYGITVNAVAPGIIDTSGLENYESQNMDNLVNRLPIKRMGTPHELATAVTYLLSPGGDFITGITLEVDGGEHLTGALQRFSAK
ncbi:MULTISPECIES: SDR family oxidoreductase [unclassified Bacillus (in: firmicutes)]|uniref:SDR family oxidoreductase n=1 Tax=unclassified Bacillus (in: firmicutes) TaxID=185979 RepID=UPI002FFF7A2C